MHATKTRRISVTLVTAALLIICAALLAGCTKTIEVKQIEKVGAKNLLKTAGEDAGTGKLDCPGDSVDAVKGKKLDCSLKFDDGREAPIQVTLTNDNGGFSAKLDGKITGGSDPATEGAAMEDGTAMEDSMTDESGADK